MKQELIIEALKKNEKPFKNIPHEMQEYMRDFNANEDIEWYSSDNCEWRTRSRGGVLDELTLYRLRPDYEPESEIVECEIYTDNSGLLVFDRNTYGDGVRIDTAQRFSDFIGFKFEDGIVRTQPIAYQLETYVNWQYGCSDEYQVLHATHVLFKK
jgi:hypothetical protein